MWIDELKPEVRSALNMIAGGLNLPELKEYVSEAAFLANVYSRIVEAKSLARQAAKVLGES